MQGEKENGDREGWCYERKVREGEEEEEAMGEKPLVVLAEKFELQEKRENNSLDLHDLFHSAYMS